MSRRKKAAPEAPTTGEVARQASREKLAEEARKAMLPAQARTLLQWLEEPLGTVKYRGRHSYQLLLTITIAPNRLPSGLDLSLREAKKAGEYLAKLGLAVFEQRHGFLYIMTVEVDDRIKSGELAWSPRDGRLTDVPGSKALVGTHGGFNVGCVAMLLYKLIGGAVDVEV